LQEILLKTIRSRVVVEENNAIFNCKTDYWSIGVILCIMAYRQFK
jgi:hypothetical protein